MSECDRETSIIRTLWPTVGCCAVDIIITTITIIIIAIVVVVVVVVVVVFVVVVVLLVLLYDITKFRTINFSYSDLSFDGNLAVDRRQDTFLSIIFIAPH